MRPPDVTDMPYFVILLRLLPLTGLISIYLKF
jgi:hypothetical protein